MVVRFKIKGTCVDDLFHVLANNGYAVQVCTTEYPDVYCVDVIIKEEEESEKK